MILEIKVKVLIDIGFIIFIILELFYDNYFQDKLIQLIKDFINIECVDGNLFIYLGYIEIDIKLVGILNCEVLLCLFLIVLDLNYSRIVLILLGINIINLFFSNVY